MSKVPVQKGPIEGNPRTSKTFPDPLKRMERVMENHVLLKNQMLETHSPKV